MAALLVVLHHVSSFVGGEPRLWVHPAIDRWFAGTSLGVSFFFVLSGIVILTAHWNDFGHPASLRSYLRKRFQRIYPIYWIILVPVLCGQLSHTDPLFPFHRDPYVVLSSILLVHIHSNETNLVVAWSLFHEIVFYVIFGTGPCSTSGSVPVSSFYGLRQRSSASTKKARSTTGRSSLLSICCSLWASLPHGRSGKTKSRNLISC